MTRHGVVRVGCRWWFLSCRFFAFCSFGFSGCMDVYASGMKYECLVMNSEAMVAREVIEPGTRSERERVRHGGVTTRDSGLACRSIGRCSVELPV